MKKRSRILPLVLSLLMMISLLPTAAFADDAVVTNAADLDVFMNIDKSVADATEFKNDVSEYLQWLIDNGGKTEIKNFRINTSAASIDPTDITKWQVYSHYDTDWYADQAAWSATPTGFNGGAIPANWYYYSISDQNKNSGNIRTTIKTMMDGRTTSNGTTWGQVAGLDSHIYSYMDSGKPAMMFYGYGSSDYSDFLYYPASKSSTKTVKFDVDASNVHVHSLKYAGFLINTDTTGDNDSKTISGYVILFAYSGLTSSTAPATGLTGVYLYKLTNANVKDLHAHGLKGITANSELAASAAIHPFYAKSHIELSITPDGLKATIQQIDDSGNLIGSVDYLFGSSDSGLSGYQSLDKTGFGGFGPYVDYGVEGHNCSSTSSFLYSNLEMSFAETLSGDSALEAYQYANYLNDSDHKYFVNLTDSSKTNYGSTASDTDNAYLSLIKNDQTVLITDEHDGTYLADTLGDNAKDVNKVTDSDLASHYGAGAPDMSTDTEKLAAKIAYQIYTSTYNSESGGTITPSTTTAIASLLLMDGPGTSGAEWTGANQINQVKKELMTSDSLKIYLDPDGSQNPTTATYTLTSLNGTPTPITPTEDTDNYGKLYFTLPKDSAAGKYTVTLTYAKTGSITTSIPATATFDVLTDATAPTPSAVISGSTANLTFTNTAAAGDTVYTSDLDSYATVINNSGSTLDTPESSDFTPVSGSTASVDLGTLAPGTHYLHMFLKDKAGNIGYASQSFTVTAPTVVFTTPATNSYTDASHQYTDSSVTFSLTKGTYDIASYAIGTGDDETYGVPVTVTSGQTSATYQLPVGAGHLWIKATDANGNDSAPISIYYNAKKHQILSGTDTYTLEAGVDTGATLDYIVTSDPALGDGESLGAISYAETSDPNNVISLTGDGVTINNHLGTATITVSAAETTWHYPTSKTITVQVVNPFSVSLSKAAYDGTGFTVLPVYTDGGSFGVSDTRELKYRSVGSSTWTTVPVADWNWNSGHPISFSGLSAGTEYEVQLSGQNNRATPTTSLATLHFKTPNASSAQTGTAEITLTSTTNAQSYSVSVCQGDAVVSCETVTGNDGSITRNIADLPYGYYNVVVEYGDVTMTSPLQIKDATPAAISFDVSAVSGSKSTRVVIDGDHSPAVTVDGLDGLYDHMAGDDAGGITSDDNSKLASGGSALIKLVSTGKDESDVDVKEDVQQIRTIDNGQSLALLVDLSLYKTIWENDTVSGDPIRMTSSSNLLTVTVPLSDIYGTDLRAYRVHSGTAQVIPEAVWDKVNEEYIWANSYSSLGLTKGDAVGAEDEFVVFTGDCAILHVSKFSTYAFGYTQYAASSTHTATIANSAHGTVTASPTKYTSGLTITLTITPDSGYQLSTLSIKDTYGNTVKYTANSNGTYSFTAPYSDLTIAATFAKKVATPVDTGVANWLITDSHISYMNGDKTGYFNPNNNMTRAEAAQMFYNLLINKNVETSAHFSDVPNDMWCRKAVETLSTLGVINGYHDGTYKPDGSITRAEFAAIAMRFAVVTDGSASFTDVTGSYWAYNSIMSAAGYGWIGGYSDGTFKPKAYITRAEVVTIVNNMLGRSADKNYVDKNYETLKIFPDVTSSGYWAFYGIVEATNPHKYNMSSGQETWNSLDINS